MKYISYFIIFIAIVVLGYFFWQKNVSAPKDQNNSNNQSNKENKENDMSNLKFPGILEESKISDKKAVIETDKGMIEFELYADKAPKTVSNFVYLAEQNYFNGLSFHRVVPNFVVQGGDPTGSGSGGPGYKFADETVVGDYKAGTVAMANAGPDTNGSQFFICLEDLPTLPKQYNLFGQVVSGMDVVKNIAVGDKMKTVTIENI